MSVWLMPAPEYFEAFFFMCRDNDGLARVIDAIRPLRLNGTLRSISHIGNDYKVLTGTDRFPWQDVRDGKPLDLEQMERIRKKFGIGVWNGSGGLYGTRGQVKEARHALRRALKGKVDRLQFVNDRTLRLLERFATPFQMVTGWDFRRTLKLLGPVYNLMKGVPTAATMGSAYWRKKTPVPAAPDPDRDGCGLLWCSPVVPNTGKDATAATQIAYDVVLAHGFEPQISISLATERSLICVITISYDRAVAGDDERAMRCYQALMERLLESGYPPYRVNVASMPYFVGDSDAYATALRELKHAFDPKGILAPGRYEPEARAAGERRKIGVA
jgi:4-cresol dehydrogenase (hydroxylating)